MKYDYVIIFAFSDGYFKYRAIFNEDSMSGPLQVIQGAWEQHVRVISDLNAVHPETKDTLVDFGKVESIEVIALHTIPFEGKPV